MNAAFLLVTTAWFAGDTTVATTAPASACCGSTSVCSSCDCGSPKLLDKLKALCKKNDCCAPAPAPKCCPAPAPKCEPKCAPACDSCHSGPKLLDKLKACFHKDKCCDTCATGCCGSAAPDAAPKAGEPIPTAPKAMPKTTGTEIPGREVRINPEAQRIQNNAGQAPAAISPSFQSDNLRSPF